MHRQRIAVVGAGLAGLVAARELQDHGARVEIFDKGRNAGGRLASRTRDGDQFDYGAQYFTVKDPRFAAFVEPLIAAGVVAPWCGRLLDIDGDCVASYSSEHERYVGVPLMRSMTDYLASKFSTLYNSCRVSRVEKNSCGQVDLIFENDRKLGPYDFVVLNTPPVQCLDLLALVESDLKKDIASVNMAPCWTLMLAFSRDPRLAAEGVRKNMDGAFVRNQPCSWIAFDSGKPGRPLGERWVIQAGAQWSREHIDCDPAVVEDELMKAFFNCLGLEHQARPALRFKKLHLWRYSNVVNVMNKRDSKSSINFVNQESPLDREGQVIVIDEANRIAVCGDWCVESRAEGAYLSGLACAEQIIRYFAA